MFSKVVSILVIKGNAFNTEKLEVFLNVLLFLSVILKVILYSPSVKFCLAFILLSTISNLSELVPLNCVVNGSVPPTTCIVPTTDPTVALLSPSLILLLKEILASVIKG